MRTNRRLLFLMCICLFGASACQIERDTPTDPRRQEDPVSPDSSASTSNDNQAGDNGESSDDGQSRDDGRSGGQKEPSDDSTGGDAGTNGSASARDADVASTSDTSVNGGVGATCTAPKVDGCNPVKNEGCLMELAMQCAIDPLAGTMAGYCTFSAPSDAGDCLNTFITESCPPTQTCFEGQCRKLCFCDGDCQQGACCVERIGEHGFKACGKC